jgi:cytochrome-b5 reductase
LNLPLGRHISVRGEVDGNKVIRAYTPTTKSNQRGYFDLLIKSYDLGKLSPHLHSLKIGAKVEIRGPVGRFNYVKNSYETIGLVAGGTGITPCLQVLRCILEGGLDGYEDDCTKFVLFYQNRKEEDILLKQELDKLATQYQSRLVVVYFLSNPSSAWNSIGDKNHRKGYINSEDISEYMHVQKAQLVCLCGPSGFNTTIKDILQLVGGHSETSIYVW